MDKTIHIRLYYGPYNFNGVIRHKIQRLHGILARLNALGYEVEIAPIDILNRVHVEMKGVIIFRCDINHLLFYVDHEEDVVAKRLLASIEEAKMRLYSDNNIPKFYTITRDRLYRKPPRIMRDFMQDSDISLLFEIKRQSTLDVLVEVKEIEDEKEDEKEENYDKGKPEKEPSIVDFRIPPSPKIRDELKNMRDTDWFDYVVCEPEPFGRSLSSSSVNNAAG